MPLAIAVVSPHPPLLIPEMAGRAAAELDDVRVALADALARLAGAAPDLLVVVGTGPVTRVHDPSATGTFGGFGLPLAVHLNSTLDTGATVHPVSTVGALPLSLTVGAWLLRDRTDLPARIAVSVAPGTPAAGCAALGESLSRRAARVGLLVMGDGSACRGDKSPGYADPRAEAFDASVTAALAAGDPQALLALDPDLATALLAAGRAPWQVLAGAACATGAGWAGRVAYDAAPYGVQYTVATWTPA